MSEMRIDVALNYKSLMSSSAAIAGRKLVKTDGMMSHSTLER